MNGALIDVDNYDLATDLWGALGMAAGIVISWFVERRWINFNAAGTTRQRVLRGIIGAAIFGIVYAWLSGAIVAGIASAHLAKFIARFISAITACLLIPLGIKLVQNARAKHQTTAE